MIKVDPEQDARIFGIRFAISRGKSFSRDVIGYLRSGMRGIANGSTHNEYRGTRLKRVIK